MAQKPEEDYPRRTSADLSHLPPLRTDHIPDDVLAQQDAEENTVDPEVHDPLANLSGVPEDVLTELDVADRTAEGEGLIPTDEEIVEIASETDARE
jgi:hypothetical protein